MEYLGKNLNKNKCKKFIEDSCDVKKSFKDSDFIDIIIYDRKSNKEIARINCFFYNYEAESAYDNMNALHIKSLGTQNNYRRIGLATYLMEQVIKYAESQNVKHITVHPYATTRVISQKDLEEFYNKFTFTYKLFLIKRKKKIEFRIVTD